MPRISEFFGIVIYMYYEDAVRHHAPHVHAIYAENEASFSIEDGRLLAGFMTRKQARRVRRWITLRREELQANWQRALSKEELLWIEP